MKPPRKPLSKRLGSALVMTLVIIVLITVVTVGYLASVMLETKTAGSNLDQERAYGIAMVGAHQAVAKIREALGPWDDPYKNFATNPPPFYWSSSPGRITRWSYSNVSPLTNIGLFSESAGTNLVNLNRELIDGSHPLIGGGSNAPAVSVKWVNLPQDPSRAADSNNPIVGRYAFWVDSEGAKINVNTADGTAKYTTNSLGIGSPTEVSLQALAGTSGQLSLASAQSIVQIARTSNFHSPREILRASGLTPDVYTSNVFSLTAYSRSPELNVFGQPRVALSPLLGHHSWTAGNTDLNSLTLLPAREIYPTPSQMPPYVIASPYDTPPNTPRNQPWPLALRAEFGGFSTGKVEGNGQIMTNAPTLMPNYSYNQGYLLAKYLAGTNAGGRPVTWPVFRGSSTQGFAGKYTPRQLDGLVAQILSIGSKAISSDYPFISGDVGEQIGHRYYVAPYLFPGWLSGQWVIGVGRSMKLTQIRVEIQTFPAAGTWDDANPTNYTPPSAGFDFWLEWWVPSGYFGGDAVLPPQFSEFFLGHRDAKSILNSSDFPRDLRDKTGTNRFAAPLPPVADTNTSWYWANQLLRNNQGIDFAGSPGQVAWSGITRLDPDQQAAQRFHDPFARTNPALPSPWVYKGLMKTNKADHQGEEYDDYASPFIMTRLRPGNDPREWQRGQLRSIRSRLSGLTDTNYRLYMQTNAASLSVHGGIAVKTQFKDGYFSDPDPVPLEAVRGAYQGNGICTEEPFKIGKSDTEMTAAWFSVPAVPGDVTRPFEPPGSQRNLRDRVLDSVIPVNADVPVPGGPVQVIATVEDPLVNKFPGDWKLTNSTTIQPSADPAVPWIYDENDAFRNRLRDPESYWMPRADVALSANLNDVARQTLIPRSARMPNIGYLQYLRTGIIPDDESLPYAYDPAQPGQEIQHGTPFRLLSFAPSYEDRDPNDPLVGQQTTYGDSEPYPDWALLDLLYIPSTLAPFGSTYNPASASPSTNAAVTNLIYYGTHGGATAGKINPNGAVIYTTNAEVAQTNVSRTLPLQAVLNGVTINQTLAGVGTNTEFTGGTTVNATNIAQAIENYVRTNGPLRMPAEICNVPEIESLRAPNNPTRNDLVRQLVGALTTQDNVFSVWTVGQAIQKNLKNPGPIQYDQFEPGDSVLAEVRLHFIVERYLDPGADGFYGNSGSAGPDGVMGTYDDPMDATNHPLQPRYLYRVVASEEIR
jgi:hypothetical protein